MRLPVTLSIAAVLFSAPAPAAAQGTLEPAPATSSPSAGGRGRIGVGVTQMLFAVPVQLFGAAGGVSAAYDAGKWYAEALVGMADPPGQLDASFGIGARFWYPLHRASSADISIGGGLGFLHLDGLPKKDDDLLVIDLGGQFRAFVVSNVALGATLGLSMVQADQQGFQISGVLLGGLGLHYYF